MSKHTQKKGQPDSHKPQISRSESAARGNKRKSMSLILKEKFDDFKSDRIFQIILLIAFIMRIPDLGRKSLWIDEMCCYQDALNSFKRIFLTVHPVVFVLEKYSMNIFGLNEFALRLPSALISFIGIFFFYYLAKIIFNRNVAIIGAFALTFNPMHVYYSQDANYYGIMMGFTIITLFFLFHFFKEKNILSLLLFFIFAALNYKVHLTNIFIIFIQFMVLLLWIMFSADFRDFAAGFFKSDRIKKNIRLVIYLVLSFLILCFLIIFGKKLWLMAFKPEGVMPPENLDLSLSFFLKLMTDYSVAFQNYTHLNFALAIVFSLIFILGIIFAWKRNSYLCILAILAWTLPFAAIYYKKIGHFYHPRYTAFIVPVFILLFSYGFWRILSCVQFFLTKTDLDEATKSGSGASKGVYAVALLLIAFFGVGFVPNLYKYYTGEKQAWDKACEFLQKNAKDDEKIVSYIFCNIDSMKFYFDWMKIDTSSLIKLNSVVDTAVFELKNLAFTHKALWYGSSYRRYEPDKITKWLEANCDKVFDIPSLHPNEINREQKEVILYKFKYSDSYILPPYLYRYSFATKSQIRDITVDNDEASVVAGLWEKTLLFDSEKSYVFQIFGKSSDKNTDTKISLMIDDEIAGEYVLSGSEEIKNYNITTHVKSGLHKISLKPQEGTQSFSATSLNIYASLSSPLVIEGEEFTKTFPTSFNKVIDINGEKAFCMKRKSFAEYQIYSPAETMMKLTIKALNDTPGPALLEVLKDGIPAGILSFDKKDDSWGEKSLPLQFSIGMNTIGIYFINELAVEENLPPEKDNDAVIDKLTLEQLSSGDISSDALQIPLASFAGANLQMPAFANSVSSGHLENGWVMMPSGSFTLESEKELDSRIAVKMDLPPKSPSYNLASPKIPVISNQIFYFSGKIKTEGLLNHSVNMMAIFLDNSNRVIAQEYVNKQGMTKDNDWTRFVYFGSVPNGAERAIAAFSVYPNSQQLNEKNETVYFADLRLERY